MKKTIDIDYYQNTPSGKKWIQKCSETWEFQSDIFCPNCGSEGVWKNNEADCDDENEHICTGCDYIFYLPDAYEIDDDETELQRLKGLSD